MVGKTPDTLSLSKVCYFLLVFAVELFKTHSDKLNKSWKVQQATI